MIIFEQIKNDVLLEFIHSEKFFNTIYALCLLMFGYYVAKRFSRIVERVLAPILSRHHVMLISRAVFYALFIMFFVSGLQHLGFNLSVLLGAAGVFTVGISFASQTAASNLISGIFLLFERPFKVGDSIEINNVSGVVESIDLLSTKLRSSDNKLIRIPNETMIKSEITNLNFYNIRRIDLIINISYHVDIDNVKTLLIKIASLNSLVLKEPLPNVMIQNFADLALELKLMAWVKTCDVTAVKARLQEEIKKQFEKEGIDMPSRRSIGFGSLS